MARLLTLSLSKGREFTSELPAFLAMAMFLYSAGLLLGAWQ